MLYDPKKILENFNKAMQDIKNAVPKEYEAFISEKNVITKSGRISSKTKWLIMLACSVTQKCPVCISRAVEHCLQEGWSKEEMLEACMVAVLIGGSSVMTYVTVVANTIEELKK